MFYSLQFAYIFLCLQLRIINWPFRWSIITDFIAVLWSNIGSSDQTSFIIIIEWNPGQSIKYMAKGIIWVIKVLVIIPCRGYSILHYASWALTLIASDTIINTRIRLSGIKHTRHLSGEGSRAKLPVHGFFCYGAPLIWFECRKHWLPLHPPQCHPDDDAYLNNGITKWLSRFDLAALLWMEIRFTLLISAQSFI